MQTREEVINLLNLIEGKKQIHKLDLLINSLLLDMAEGAQLIALKAYREYCTTRYKNNHQLYFKNQLN